ncbi:hypothetical protein AMS68_003565 [Peltaster fructicola]|uniref:Uncharacterized protein n=1 Tax=Peltaster fructicola TaxID=286661 RepID=A0A6H0XTW0_9PEZI|nr:hypothetical protein AMS68_003565 [Peltaster fructicola]
MHSPLPDSSALEAGILEDAPPSRLSRVQDNVRNLLRSSMLGSVRSSPRVETPTASPHQPARFATAHVWPQPEVLPSPTESMATTASTDSSATTASTTSQRSTDGLLPNAIIHQMARQSALFDTRAIAALNHPDLETGCHTGSTRSDVRHKHRHAWKRSKRRELHHNIVRSQCVLIVIVGLALAGLVATYIALAVTSTQAPPVFHILFILGIMLIGIAFIHAIARMVFVDSYQRRRHGKTRHRHRHEHTTTRARVMPNTHHFSPTMPIPVVTGTDEVRLDPTEAQPSTAVHQPPEVWDKDSARTVTNPPPAYGRWRGSVRADPQLLHWQAVSPVEEVISIPSPTYEDSQAQSSAGSPPSYKTKESPARTRTECGSLAAQALPVPEMVQGHGIGIAE